MTYVTRTRRVQAAQLDPFNLQPAIELLAAHVSCQHVFELKVGKTENNCARILTVTTSNEHGVRQTIADGHWIVKDGHTYHLMSDEDFKKMYEKAAEVRANAE